MALQHKRIITAGGAPTTGQVSEGEIVINLADGEIFTETDTAAIKSIGIGRDILNSAIASAKLAMNPVGSVVLRIDAIDPSTIFGGTWALLPTGGSLSTGDGLAQTGLVAGTDTVAVPLLEHNHTGGLNNGAVTINDPGHWHAGWSGQGQPGSGGGADPGQSLSTNAGSITNATGITAGVTDWSITTDVAGTPGATINVAGAELIVNAWQRTA